LNILSVGGSYKPANGGNARRISTMCQAFVSLGHEVTVCTCAGFDGSSAPETIQGVRVYRFADWKALRDGLKAVIAACRIDILLVHEETYLRVLPSVGLQIPVVYECHAIEPNPSRIKEAVLHVMRRRYLRAGKVKAVFVLSRNAKSWFSKKMHYPAERVHYTPNGVEKSEYTKQPVRFGENKEFVYGYAGTLYEFQGIRVLLHYCRQLLEIAEDVRIMIVGGGPLEREVREHIEANGMRERVICTGSVDQQEFDNLVAQFDVMLMPRPSMPSTESAVPLKIFDAAIHKKPVVMSNVSGLTAAFSEDAALIYDTQDPDGFVACCQKLYRNEALARKLVAGEEEALRRWPTVEQVAAAQLQVMETIINKGR